MYPSPEIFTFGNCFKNSLCRVLSGCASLHSATMSYNLAKSAGLRPVKSSVQGVCSSGHPPHGVVLHTELHRRRRSLRKSCGFIYYLPSFHICYKFLVLYQKSLRIHNNIYVDKSWAVFFSFSTFCKYHKVVAYALLCTL